MYWWALFGIFTLQGGSGGGTMGPVKKIFVGGIAHGTTEEDIKTHFMQFGAVSVRVLWNLLWRAFWIRMFYSCIVQ